MAATLLRGLGQFMLLRGARFLVCLERVDWRRSLKELGGVLISECDMARLAAGLQVVGISLDLLRF